MSARTLVRLLSFVLSIGGAWFLSFSMPVFAQETTIVTKIHQFYGLTGSDNRVRVAARLEGTVLVVDTPGHTIALRDESAVALLNLDPSEPALRPGDKIRLEGDCAIEGQTISVGRVAVVDNDGLHALKEKSGTIFLKSGRHPIRVCWFDAGGDVALELSWQGPHFAREPIPSRRLFHFEPSAAGSNLVSGLEYRCYEAELSGLTNFTALTPIKQGITTDFNLNVRSRSNNVALEFSGCIDVPDDGEYVFCISSDDGSQLFVEEKPALVQKLGRTTFPQAVQLLPGQNMTEEPRWARVEGKVMFAGRRLDGWTLEMRARGGRMDVELPEVPGYHPESWLRSEVRLTGVALSTWTTEGVKIAGRLIVPGPEQVELLQPVLEHRTNSEAGAGTLPVITTIEQIHRLKAEEAGLNYPVRIRGVVTCAWSWNVNGMIQDATRGIFVPNLSPGSATTAQIGDYLEVEGNAAPGDFAPVINATRVTSLGRGLLPEPIKPSLDQLLNGSLDCQFVELEGVVTSVETNGLSLLMRGGRLSVDLEDWGASSLQVFENSRVRIRGALSAVWDPDTHQVVSGRIFLHPVGIDLEEPAPANLFSLPSKGIDELKKFDADAGALQRVKLTGQILHMRHSQYFILVGTNGARFAPRSGQTCRIGDQVEVVGFPEIDGASPLLRDAVIQVQGSAPLPVAQHLLAGVEVPTYMIGRRVEMEGRILGAQWEQGELDLELQDVGRTYLARLSCAQGVGPLLPINSRVQLTGVCIEADSSRDTASVGRFELLLNSPSDIVVLGRPSWWTAEHALVVAGGLGGVLLLAVGWIRALRRQVEQRTGQLHEEIEQHKRAEAEVNTKAKLLAEEIEERKRIELEVERVHKQLLMTSRTAGMAEVATSILHNVGNVLNSVNVSAGVIAQNLRQSKAPSLLKVAELLRQRGSTPGFLESDEKGKQIPQYLQSLGERLAQEQQSNAAELGGLQKNIEHIKRIVAMQQDYARLGGVTEKVELSEIVEDAIRINAAALARHNVELVRDFQADPQLLIEKHKVLQILVNLIQNAKFACVESQRANCRVVVQVALQAANRVGIRVKDNGCGISGENLKRIFSPGFTTRKEGHGFGLHASILAARDLKGDLKVTSDGLGTGASFTLELPLTHELELVPKR